LTDELKKKMNAALEEYKKDFLQDHDRVGQTKHADEAEGKKKAEAVA
jgi:hypothetical protein